MPLCPKCSSQLSISKIKYFCSNEECTFNCRMDELSELNLNWAKELCREDSFWHKKVVDDYPSIIAHEYYRLYFLLDRGQTYGVLLQYI